MYKFCTCTQFWEIIFTERNMCPKKDLEITLWFVLFWVERFMNLHVVPAQRPCSPSPHQSNFRVCAAEASSREACFSAKDYDSNLTFITGLVFLSYFFVLKKIKILIKVADYENSGERYIQKGFLYKLKECGSSVIFLNDFKLAKPRANHLPALPADLLQTCSAPTLLDAVHVSVFQLQSSFLEVLQLQSFDFLNISPHLQYAKCPPRLRGIQRWEALFLFLHK